jgi:hypothetical protein
MSNTMDKLRELKDNVSQSLFGAGSSSASSVSPSDKLPPAGHYVGVGIGYKNGDPKAGYALRFYVRRKLLPGDLAPSHCIKGLLHGMMTDVAEVRPFSGYARKAAQAKAIASGAGAGIQFQSQFTQGPMGTLGAVLVDANGRQYALGANHVLARNNSVTRLAGFTVMDTSDAGSVVFRPVPIGNSVRFAPLRDGCTVDCALVEPAAGVTFKQKLPVPPGKLTATVTEPVIGRPAAKFGFATQWTRGVIGDLNATVRLDCGAGLGVISIADTVLVRDEAESDDVAQHDGEASFAAPGDSGALVFQQDEAGYWSPCGMVVGGPVGDPRLQTQTEDYIAVCRLSTALDALNQELYPDKSAYGSGLQLAEFEAA